MFARSVFICCINQTNRQPCRKVRGETNHARPVQSPNLLAPPMCALRIPSHIPTPIRAPAQKPTQAYLCTMWRHRSHQATQNQAKPSHTNQQINTHLYSFQRTPFTTQPKTHNLRRKSMNSKFSIFRLPNRIRYAISKTTRFKPHNLARKDLANRRSQFWVLLGRKA